MIVSMVRAGTGPSWLVNDSNEKSRDISGENGFLEVEVGAQSGSIRIQDLSGSQDHLEETAQLHLPTCLLSTKVVSHLLCKVDLTINYLYHLWPVLRDRVREGGPVSERGLEILGYCKSLPSVPKPD